VSYAGEDTGSKVDYVAMLNKLSEQDRDESLNAAPFYRKAAELHVELPEEIKYQELLQWPTELPNSHLKVIKQWIESNSNAMAQLRLGTQKPYFWNQYKAKTVLEADMEHNLRPLRFVIFATLFLGKLKVIEQGMTRETAENFLVCIRVGSHLTQTFTIHEQLSGLGCIYVSIQAVYLCLMKTDYNEMAIGSLQSSIHEQFLKIQNQTFSLEAEKLHHLEVVQFLFQGTNDDSKLKAEEEMFLAARMGGLTYEELQAVRRGKTLQDLAVAHAYCKDFLSMSPWQGKEKGLNFWDDIYTKTGGNPVVIFCMIKVPTVNVPGVVRVIAHGNVRRDALLATLSLIKYRQDKGRFPKDLQELLATDYLSQLPMDPYSNGPLIYKQTGDDFLLYSLGEDFDDDGGTHSNWGRDEQGGDYVFWPIQTKSDEKDE
jgi:hypothetical protein